MSQEENQTESLSDRVICIIGPHKLQNNLLALFLEKETGATSIHGEDFHEVVLPGKQGDGKPVLFLWDYLGKPLDSLLEELKTFDESTPPSHYIALFNVVFDPREAQRALDFGIRGFFYENDSLGQITKGIRAIFADELWVSREILTKRILEKRETEEKFQKPGSILTTREMEILSLVAAGITNEEIADRLCISPHTVRTHVYNIFKKINVPNRLQAALWAVNNL